MLGIPLLKWLSQPRESRSRLDYEPNTIFAFIVYFIVAFLAVTLNLDSLYFNSVVRDILIIFSPLVVFSFGMTFNDNHIKALFVAVVISYFSWVGIQSDFNFDFNFVKSNYNLASEFHNGVIIGGFLLYFLYRKNWLWSILALLLVFMSGKRSIFLGILPAIASFYLFFQPFGITKNRSLLFFFTLLYFLIFYFVGINLDTVSTWFLEEIVQDSDLTLHRFLMGREVFILYLKNAISEADIVQYLFGYGPGQADMFLLENARPDWIKAEGAPVNPHNDFLKIRYDYGLLGSLAFFLIMYSVYIRSNLGLQMFMYTIPLFLVDNSFIFIYYWFIALVISRQEVEEKKVLSD